MKRYIAMKKLYQSLIYELQDLSKIIGANDERKPNSNRCN